MPLNFLVFTFIQIFLGLSILLGHIFSQFASTCGNTRASTCSNTRASMLPYGSSTCVTTRASTCSNTCASTCYYASARLLFKNMPPGPLPGIITRSMTTPEPPRPLTLPPQPLQPPAHPPVPAQPPAPALAPPHQTQHVTHILSRPCLPINPTRLRRPPAGEPGNLTILDRLRTRESSGQVQYLVSPAYTSPLHVSRHEGLPRGGGINHTQD